jgi:type I restriction enzyme S subunit
MLNAMKTNMQKYPAYKDSGVEWLGEIPNHWEVKKVTHVFNKIGSGTTPTAGALKYYDNGQINWLQTGDLNDGLIDDTNKKITKKAITDFSTLKQYPKESIVLAMYGATIGKLGYLNIETTTNQACCVLGNPNTFSSKYGFYSFMNAKTSIISMSYGGGQPNISQDLVKSLRLSVPPLPEQTAIAAFLDRKTALIDQAISIKQKQIELLKERRQILIHNAVTRGLNPNVKMKDSGVEWIGEIPESWEVSKLGYLTYKIGDGLHGTPNYTDETEFYFINGNNLGTGYIEITEQTKTVSEREYSLHKKDLTENTLLLSINGTIGNVAFYQGEKVMLGKSAAYLNFYSDLNIEFIKWFLESSVFKNYYELQLSGSTINNFSLYSIGKTPIILPSKNEQKEIVEFLKSTSSKIATAISLKEQEIEKLKEYKATLINSAVTGKIKVS